MASIAWVSSFIVDFCSRVLLLLFFTFSYSSIYYIRVCVFKHYVSIIYFVIVQVAWVDLIHPSFFICVGLLLFYGLNKHEV